MKAKTPNVTIGESRVIAKEYVRRNGLVLLELCSIDGGYIVAENGQIPDARRKLSANEARTWYDSAAIQVGPRPGTTTPSTTTPN
jgi:hypothetical protein